MKFQGKEIEIVAKRSVFNKELADIRFVGDSRIFTISISELDYRTELPSPDDLVFKAIAAKIRYEINNHKMLAPLESNILPLPHQILALEKVMSGQYIRFLLADEVGMGKTIEAGLILKELKMRGIVKRALIIVGKTALLQWQQELKKHFNEHFHIYDTEYINALAKTISRFDADNEVNIWAQHNQLIVSLDSLKPVETRQGWTRKKVDEYNKYRIESVLNAEFDLLIIDECHKVGGSTHWIGRYQMAAILCNAIPNVLLLSATPHRGKSDHFRRIVQLLDEDAFAGEGMPKIPELEPYVVRTEKRQAIDYNGKQLFNKRITQTVDVFYDEKRHRKQKQLYSEVTEYVVNGFNLAQQTKNSSYGFVMILFQRMMSSSTQAILEAMEKRAERLAGEKDILNKQYIIADLDDFGFEGQLEFDFEEKINNLVKETQINYETELTTLKNLIKLARDCHNSEEDAKIEFLLEKLSDLKISEDEPSLKFLIFTEFTATQRMLKKILEEKGGYLCEMINGSMDFDKRIIALQRFKDTAQVLISTDAAGESLNMQFAHIVINYDIPWNPMVLEQRIGRVDRIGQVHAVKALNFLLDNSVEHRVYEVIEIKLNQIMEQLGIDKTTDVLDSTLERENLNRLYLKSLLDPERFEQAGANWLEEIKLKLKGFQSTEGSLPIVDSADIKAEKVDAIKHSPLPIWLEKMTINYLCSKNIPYRKLADGLQFIFPGFNENIYTFNIKESINNPIPEPLSLQHEIIQKMFAEAIPYTESQLLPVVKPLHSEFTPGYFTLWRLSVKNQFESQEYYQPLFFTDANDSYIAYAQDVWNKLSQDSFPFAVIRLMQESESKANFNKVFAFAQEHLLSKYQQLEDKIESDTLKIRNNKDNAFSFRERQLNKIGIENIRVSRLQKLRKEKEIWMSSFDSAKQIVPELQCLSIMYLSNE